MTIRLEHGSWRRFDLTTRLPFRYGIVTMTACPHLFVRLAVTIDGRSHVGQAADHLPPKWFTKEPQRALDEEIDEMLVVIRAALDAAAGMTGPDVFTVWRELYERQEAWGRQARQPPLLTHFGTSLVERALIDAQCRAAQVPFGQALRSGLFGVRLGDIHAELRGRQVEELLPPPRRRLFARHTVGLLDPLTDEDVAPADRLRDGLPQTLEECWRLYGLRHLKIKIGGDPVADGARLKRLAALAERVAPRDLAFSLDGNELFRSLPQWRDWWSAVRAVRELSHFFDRLLFVEQPLHRQATFDAAGDLTVWHDRPPTIIDEADGTLDSLPQALRHGYDGTSHKNCKGVFKGVANRCLLRLRQTTGSRPSVMSGEDLVNIGPIALLQDLAVCAALGLDTVERNGHHYFAGLTMFPEDMQNALLRHHPDLYHPALGGRPTLRLVDGELALDSVIAAPFGVVPLLTE